MRSTTTRRSFATRRTRRCGRAGTAGCSSTGRSIWERQRASACGSSSRTAARLPTTWARPRTSSPWSSRWPRTSTCSCSIGAGWRIGATRARSCDPWRRWRSSTTSRGSISRMWSQGSGSSWRPRSPLTESRTSSETMALLLFGELLESGHGVHHPVAANHPRLADVAALVGGPAAARARAHMHALHDEYQQGSSSARRAVKGQIAEARRLVEAVAHRRSWEHLRGELVKRDAGTRWGPGSAVAVMDLSQFATLFGSWAPRARHRLRRHPGGCRLVRAAPVRRLPRRQRGAGHDRRRAARSVAARRRRRAGRALAPAGAVPGEGPRGARAGAGTRRSRRGIPARPGHDAGAAPACARGGRWRPGGVAAG